MTTSISGDRNFFIKEGYRCNYAAAGQVIHDAESYWTAERIRLSLLYQYHVYRLAARLARANGFKSCLDVGCGPATKAAAILKPAVESICLVDQASCAPLAARHLPRERFVSIDLERCDSTLGERFDLVLCADVIEHLLDPTACLEFTREHLRRGGIAVFSTPDRDALRGQGCNHSSHDSHVREWNRREFRRLLEWKGLRVTRQISYPAVRLPVVEECTRLLTPPWCAPRKWRHCQVAICTH